MSDILNYLRNPQGAQTPPAEPPEPEVNANPPIDNTLAGGTSLPQQPAPPVTTSVTVVDTSTPLQVAVDTATDTSASIQTTPDSIMDQVLAREEERKARRGHGRQSKMSLKWIWALLIGALLIPMGTLAYLTRNQPLEVTLPAAAIILIFATAAILMLRASAMGGNEERTETLPRTDDAPPTPRPERRPRPTHFWRYASIGVAVVAVILVYQFGLLSSLRFSGNQTGTAVEIPVVPAVSISYPEVVTATRECTPFIPLPSGYHTDWNWENDNVAYMARNSQGDEAHYPRKTKTRVSLPDTGKVQFCVTDPDAESLDIHLSYTLLGKWEEPA